MRKALLAAVLCIGAIGVSSMNVDAAVTGPKTFTVKITVKNGQNKTFLLVSKTGRTLASAKVGAGPSNASKAIELKTTGANKVRSIAGATVQIVATNGGDYYGPVVVGWKKFSNSKPNLNQANRVYTKLKSTTQTTVSLGEVQITNVGRSGLQGYGAPKASSTFADVSTAAEVRATNGKPKGVGNYGKSSTASSEIGPFAESCGPPPLPPCGGGGGGDTDPDQTVGGDADDDGVPNAFDVNDDGDSRIDSADADTPTPQAAPTNEETGQSCGAVEYRIFTNFKATQPKFTGSLNAYGVGDFAATRARSAAAITRTMTMVFSKVMNVCGSNVVKTELKGVGVPYMPSEYTELAETCNTGDYQFSVGSGKMCGNGGYDINPGGYDFAAGGTLPSGQDTFQVRLTTADGNQYEITSSPGFVFVTHPMLVAYGTDPANLTDVDYSHTTTEIDGTGLASDPLITVGASQVLYLEIYRPQRLAFDGELGSDFYDLGGYKYTPDIPNYRDGESGPSVGKCDALTTTDISSEIEGGLNSDQPVDLSTPRTLILEWDISSCITNRGFSWHTGAFDFDIQVEPIGPGGNSAQKVRVTFE